MLQEPCVTVNEWKINRKVFGSPYKVTMRMG